MIGVTAIALDQGYRVVIVLAGGKDDLRRQTARRFNIQLLAQRDEIPGVEGAFTIPAHVPQRPCGGIGLPYSVDVHKWAPGYIRIRETLRKDEPCVFVIKKNMASLLAMRQLLSRAYGEFGGDKLPTLVLDDECDDSSVDEEGAPIPEGISNLWRQSAVPPFVYVGYTATAAANLLQKPDNDLYPENFVYLLRYPSSDESTLTVREPEPERWYSGSETFYESFGQSPGLNENFLIDDSVKAQDVQGPVEQNESLRDALRSYLVAGAYRLALQPNASFSDPTNLPNPHSMLIQTSALMDEHERTLEGLAKMFGGRFTEGKTLALSEEVVSADVVANESSYESWFNEFSLTRERLYLERPSARKQLFVSWSKVKSLLATVVKNVRIKAVNSDPELGQDLDYAPRLMEDGSVLPPEDIYVVVVGGSKLSRGITLEGLCTSYFTRWVPNPTEDTVLQISRWFGYRGAHLEFCRLFTTLDIYNALTEIHENDRELRAQLWRLMEERKTPRDAGLVLMCSPRALPTGKLGVGKVFDVRFSPFQTVFRSVEIDQCSGLNESVALQLVNEVRGRSSEIVLTDGGAKRGEVSRGWSALEVATALESFAYSDHNPSLSGNPAGKFHRSPDATRSIRSAFAFRSDPYQVAAYLREWTARAAQGKTTPPPQFNVGFALGQMQQSCSPFDFPLLDRVITRSGKLLGEWTGRSAGWRGDSLFDNPERTLLLAGSTLRMAPARGLLLLYVIHKDAVGRFGEGYVRPFHTPTFGISIPDGGPELRRVTVSPS